MGGTRAGVVTQGGAHVGEGLLVVAGLVHAPLRWTRRGSWVSSPQPPVPAPRCPPRPAGPAHLVEGPGVHGGVAALEHGAVPHQHRAVGLCTHLCGDGGGVGVSRAWPGPHAHPQASQGPALTVELAHGAGVYLTLQRGRAVPRPPGVHEERGGALHDARAGHEVVRRVPVEGATEPCTGRAVRGASLSSCPTLYSEAPVFLSPCPGHKAVTGPSEGQPAVTSAGWEGLCWALSVLWPRWAGTGKGSPLVWPLNWGPTVTYAWNTGSSCTTSSSPKVVVIWRWVDVCLKTVMLPGGRRA